MGGVRVDSDFEQELLEELPESLGVPVGPASWRHAVDLIYIYDQTLTSRIFMHRVALDFVNFV
jgi:hypothetical protein